QLTPDDLGRLAPVGKGALPGDGPHPVDEHLIGTHQAPPEDNLLGVVHVDDVGDAGPKVRARRLHHRGGDQIAGFGALADAVDREIARLFVLVQHRGLALLQALAGELDNPRRGGKELKTPYVAALATGAKGIDAGVPDLAGQPVRALVEVALHYDARA